VGSYGLISTFSATPVTQESFPETGLETTPVVGHVRDQLRNKGLHAAVDVFNYRPDLLDWQAGRVFEFPVDVPVRVQGQDLVSE
jgi:hypothetical protein